MAGNCGSGALRDLLQWAGLGWGGPPREGLVFGLGGNYGFSYVRNPQRDFPYVVGATASLEVDILERIGADVEVCRTDDPELGWLWVVEELAASRPVMVWAEIAELPYLRVRLSMSRHDIVVIGYDESARVVYVVDNDRLEVQELPFEVLARARRVGTTPVPTRHTTFRVQWPRELPDLRGTASAALLSAVTTMEQPDLNCYPGHEWVVGGDVAAAGLDGVQAFVDDLATWPERLSDDLADAALRALYPLVDKAGTGGGLFRLLQAEFCEQVGALTGQAEFRGAAESLRRCAATWSAVADAGRGPSSVSERCAKTSAAAEDLPQHEAEAVGAMRRAAEALTVGR